MGKGAGGTVYRAVHSDSSVKSTAAIKVISIPTDPAELDSLFAEGLSWEQTRTYLENTKNDVVREIQLMVSLKGAQNIVSVEDFKVMEKENGQPGWDIYIRMELLTSLSNYIRDKKLTEAEVIKLGCDICTALEVCKKKDIIHRDIKLDNIFVSSYGSFKLGDFGIARTMENLSGGLSQNKGTANYMAPEVVRSGNYDSRADLYSLGLVLYCLLNDNQLPFLDAEKQLNPNERALALERRFRGELLPVPCEASPEMADLILCACAYDPDSRFPSATEMRRALESISNGTYTYQRRKAVNFDDEKTTGVRNRAVATTPDRSVKTDDTYQELLDDYRGIQQKSEPRKQPPRFGSARPKKGKLIAVALVGIILVSAGISALRPREETPSEKLARIMAEMDEEKERNEELESQEETPEIVKYSKLDEEQIASIVSEAETLAAAEDHEGALRKVKIGLITYPGAESLLNKEKEYTGVLNAQVRATILEEAEALADAGNYMGALQAIEGGIATIGEDPELVYTKQSFEAPFVADVSAKVDGLLAAREFDSADELLSQAEKAFPDNAAIAEKKGIVDSSRPQHIMEVSPAFQYRIHDYYSKSRPLYEEYTNGKTFNMGGESYTDGFVLIEFPELANSQPKVKYNNRTFTYSFASFNLGGKYSIVEFDMGHVDGTDSEDRLLNIYLDDELTATLPLKFSATVQHIPLEVTGKKQIRFEMLYSSDWTSRKNVSYGFANFVGHPSIDLPEGMDPIALGIPDPSEAEEGSAEGAE